MAAARDLLGPQRDRAGIGQVLLASTTLPFADRLNAGVVAAALKPRLVPVEQATAPAPQMH